MATLSNSVRRGLKIFILLVVVTMLVLLVFTGSRETISALRRMNVIYLFGAIILWGVYLTLDSFRISLLAHGVTGKWTSMKTGYEILLTGAFLAAVTPFQTGGLPVQLYILKKEEVSLGRGTLILLLRGIFFGVMMATLLPFLLPILNKETSVPVVRMLSRYSFVVYGVLIGLLAFLLIKPRVIERFFYRVTLRKGKITKAARWTYKTFKEIKEMRKGFFRFSVEKKWHSLASFFLTYLAFIPYFFIAPLLLKGLGVDVSFIHAAFLQLVVVIFTFFSPTPGATGVSEGGLVLLFSPLVAKHLLGVFTILWRFFTFYLAAIIGGFVVLKVLKLGSEEF
ncbi:flippase-like domain-containing protein [candidate division WOR-3 bacterium]|nr:flippase-like domain-containing protein [candidate division WOR-3 bacterium]